MTPLAILAALAIGLGDAPPPAMPPASTFTALGEDAAQDLVILGEARPILIRLRVMIGDRSFRSSWMEGTRLLHSQLDRDGDGKLTVAEAEAGGLALLIGSTAKGTKVEADVSPKDGVISVEELAEAIRGTSGPFRVQADGLEGRRTDALFNQFDRDKDGHLTRPELAAVVGSLRKLDRDNNELIGTEEVNPAAAPDPDNMIMGRPASRDLAVPPVVALMVGESPMRVVRLLLKKYDKGSARGPGKTDSKLSAEEFAIPSKVFSLVDTNGDGQLTSEELRGYLEKSPRDTYLDVALTPEASGHPAARVSGPDGKAPEGFTVRRISDGAVEIEVGLLRIDIHIDDGLGAIDATRQTLKARFEAADTNQDGYLEESELTQDNGLQSPFAGLFRPIDRNADGKLYPAEIDDFVAKQAASARGRLTLTASDQGHALFGLLDLDRDRKLGAREVLDTFARVSACDRDHDGRISPEEVPHHIQLTLARGDLSALLVIPANNNNAVAVRGVLVPPPSRVPVGPAWFRKMDRNRDGDVSRREFLGTHEQFDRLDRDHDGLLSPDEAEAAKPVN